MLTHKIFILTIPFLFCFICFIEIIGLNSNTFALDDGSPIITITKKDPIPFVAFSINDLINPKTNRPYDENDIVEIKDKEILLWKGYAKELLGIMNQAQKYYNTVGEDLRGKGALKLVELATDGKIFEESFLSQLRLRASILKDKIKKSLKNCELITIPKLGFNFNTKLPYIASDVINIDGSVMTIDQYVDRINEQQKFLCSIGYSIVDGFDGMESDVIKWVQNSRERLLEELGISKFNPIFDMSILKKAVKLADLTADIDRLLKEGNAPSIQQLWLIEKKINAQLPPQYKIPELPNWPSPTMPTRADLKIIKGKNWDYNNGDKSIAAIYAHSDYAIKGSDSDLFFRAEAKAGAWVIGNELNLIYGGGYFEAATDQLKGETKVQVFGQQLYYKNFSEKTSVVYEDPSAWKYDWGSEYSYNFMIGPVPATMTIGVHAEMKFAYKLGLYLTKIYGEIRPSANAFADARGGIGWSNVLSAGVGGNIHLIDASLPIYGSTSIIIEPQGFPRLDLNVGARFEYEYLNGNLYGFVTVPWIEMKKVLGVPYPWLTTKDFRKDVFSWGGQRGELQCLNWGLELTPFGGKASGDLLDQTDRDELKDLNEALELEQRKLAVAKSEQEIFKKAQQLFSNIVSDLSSENNLFLEQKAQTLKEFTAEIDKDQNAYLQLLEEMSRI